MGSAAEHRADDERRDYDLERVAGDESGEAPWPRARAGRTEVGAQRCAVGRPDDDEPGQVPERAGRGRGKRPARAGEREPDDERETAPAERVGRSGEPQGERAAEEQEAEKAVVCAAALGVDARASGEELREEIQQE